MGYIIFTLECVVNAQQALGTHSRRSLNTNIVTSIIRSYISYLMFFMIFKVISAKIQLTHVISDMTKPLIVV